MCSVNIGWGNEHICTRESYLLYRQSIIEEKRGMAFIARAWVTTVPPLGLRLRSCATPSPFALRYRGHPSLSFLYCCLASFVSPNSWSCGHWHTIASPFWCLSPVRITDGPCYLCGNSFCILCAPLSTGTRVSHERFLWGLVQKNGYTLGRR